MNKYTKKTIHSPVENTLRVIGSKWTVLIIRELKEGVRRFGELEKALTGISPRTLSLRLSHMEEYGIIERKVYPEVPPRVEYKLSPLGKTLAPVLKTMEDWGKNFAKRK
jgi:DNA-binding HxlR family transcriptional regulator